MRSLMDEQGSRIKRCSPPKKLGAEALFDPGPVERALKILGAQQK
jgi:hypothetical protein